MKLISAEQGNFTFRFEKAAREWFSHILGIFPVQTNALGEISDDAAAKELLAKTLAERRTKLSAEAQSILRAGKIEIDKDFCEFWDLTLTAEQAEELLQILNNVRVGLWIQLGRPEIPSDVVTQTPQSEDVVRSQMIMHVCAAWQGALMEAMDG